MEKKENQNEEFNTITLTFDNDLVVNCEVIAIFPVKDKEYMALRPVEEVEGIDSEELFIYRYTPSDDSEEVNLETIEDDDEYEDVVDALEQLLEECEDLDAQEE